MRVLYIDDEADIRDVAGMALELDGDMTVATAGSGQDALLEVGRFRPDIILLDVMMPDMDGPTTFARLREHDASRDIPVAFITARTQAHEVERFLRLGAIGVIPKPFDPMTLAAEVRALFARIEPARG